MEKLTDPADKGKQKRESKDVTAKFRELDVNNLDPAAMKPFDRKTTRIPSPFEGYPEKRITVGTYKTETGEEKPLILNATHMVGLNPAYNPPQDISGENVLIGDPLKGAHIGTIETTHNRVTTYGRDSFNAVFDREIEIKGVVYKYAIIPEAVHRAQVMFVYNSRTNRIDVDERYLPFDRDQASRLRQVFQMILNPKLKAERIAGAIAGESPESLDDLTGVEGGMEGDG